MAVNYAVGFEAVFHDTAEKEAALALNLTSGKPLSNRIWLWKLKLDKYLLMRSYELSVSDMTNRRS